MKGKATRVTRSEGKNGNEREGEWKKEGRGTITMDLTGRMR